MATTEQKKEFLKAKIAIALHDELGRVLKTEEIDQVFLLARVMYKAVLGLHYQALAEVAGLDDAVLLPAANCGQTKPRGQRRRNAASRHRFLASVKFIEARLAEPSLKLNAIPQRLI